MRKKLIFNFSLILFIVLALFTLSSCGDESGSDLNKTTENDDNKESYTVTWYNDDNSVLETDLNVEEGDMPSYDGETPKKENEEGCSYQFIGWDKEFSKVENNVSYKATFRKVLDICEYKFVDDNDKVISYGSVCYGEEVERPDSAKASDFKYSYEFLGWYVNDELVSDFHIKEDTIFKAKYSKTINKYNIKFVNYDDSVIYEFNMEYGKQPIILVNPTRPSTETESFQFAGWDSEITPAISDKVYKATYKSKDRIYNVKFVDGNNVISNLNYKYDEIINKPNDPVKAKDERYTYEFLGWYDKDDNKVDDFGNVKSNITYYAKYKEIANKYTITFKNPDGTILKTSELEYGEMPTYEGTPAKDGDAQYTYSFAKWDKEITSVTKDEVYTAEYTRALNTYTIEFYGYSGLVSSVRAAYGESYTVPTVDQEIKEEYSKYVFEGWFTDTEGKETAVFSTVTEDAIFYAHYKEVKNKYTITFDTLGGSSIDSITAEWGTAITKPSDPTKKGYTFLVWKTSIPAYMPKYNLKITASWQVHQNPVNIEVNDPTLVTTNITSGTNFDYDSTVKFEATIASGFSYIITKDGESASDSFEFKMPDSAVNIKITVSTYSRSGNTIVMGSYPQTLVKDENLIPELLKKSGGTSSGGWSAYSEYYDGTGTSNYMYYKDITYSGKKYRAVYFTKYRADYGMEAKEENSYVDDNGYKINEIYFFKYEPITWTIISEADGKAKCVSNLVLDAQAFTLSTNTGKYAHKAASQYTSYSNNYFYSDIREWLNHDILTIGYSSINYYSFMDAAFTGNQLEHLAKLGRANPDTRDDYVGLINTSDVPTNLQGYGTDYAMIQGLEVDSNKACAYYTGSASGNGLDVLIVNSNGEYSGTAQCNYTHIGIRPVINIVL